MTGYKRVNFYELCRLCTSSQQKDKVHIFREEGKKMNLQHKIQTCFPLIVCEHDYLPKVVCSSCISSLEESFTFRQNCINSEAMLSSYFSNFRFTEDFKKAGKVYVKDTGQAKPEKITNTINNIPNIVPNIVEKKNAPTPSPQPQQQQQQQQESTVNAAVLSNIIREGIQYYPQEKNESVLQNKIQQTNLKPNIQTQNIQTVTVNEYQDISTSTGNTIHSTISKEIPNVIKYQQNTQITNTISIPNTMSQINYNSNTVGTVINNNKNGFDQTKTYIENLSSEFTNVLKSNIPNNSQMVVIDMEQLIDTGLHESEVNKLKEVLLKPPEYKKAKDKPNLNNSSDKESIDGGSVKMYKCDDCSKVFKRREHLYQHTKLHSGVRPFSCIHCPKNFSRKEHLMRHLTSHSGVKEFSCDICSKRFSRPDNLKKHKKTHQKMPYRCDICSKDFVIKHYYTAHMQAHQNGENILENIIKPEDAL